LSVSRYIDENTRQEVRKRAKYLCEYCHAIEKWQYVQFTIDHVIPLDQGGTNSLDNLALVAKLSKFLNPKAQRFKTFKRLLIPSTIQLNFYFGQKLE
jgi:hypothetical protein